MTSPDPQSSRRNGLLPWILLAAVPLLISSCEQEPTTPPDPPLDPVSRVASLAWVVTSADPAELAATVEAVPTYTPTAVFLGGDLAPTLDGSSSDAFESALAVFVPTGAFIGIEVSALGDSPPAEMCFDPNQPTDDPHLQARANALSGLLEANPEVVDVSVSVAGPPSPWDVSCACTPCDGVGTEAMAERLQVGFEALEAATEDYGAQIWWGDDLADPTPDGFDVPGAMDHALGVLRPEGSLRVRASSYRGQDQTWAPENPQLDAAAHRQVAADLDLVFSDLGPTEAPLVFVDDLLDRIHRDRERGVLAWFVGVDGPHRSAFGRPEEANVYFVERMFRDSAVTPRTLLTDWIQAEYGLAVPSPEADSLALALRNTGPAFVTATHPLGLSVVGAAEGIGPLPLTYADPRPWGEGWDERWEVMTSPTANSLIEVHQWGAEAVGMSQTALDAFEEATEDGALPTAAAEDLARRLAVLHAATRAWKATVSADVTLKLWQESPSEQYAEWLRRDADELEALAREMEDAVDEGSIHDPFPADPTALYAVTLQIRTAVGEGTSTERPFPSITEVSWNFEDSRTNIHWTLRPGGSGWWVRGLGWPGPYEVSSQIGEGPSVFWHAWTNNLDPDVRIVFRACGESEGYEICTSDRVLWTPP